MMQGCLSSSTGLPRGSHNSDFHSTMFALMGRAILLLLGLLLVTSPVPAQSAPPIGSGERVRLTLPSRHHPRFGSGQPPTVLGTVSAVRGDTLVLRIDGGAGSAMVALASVVGLEVSLGVPSRAEGAVRGAGRGVLQGVLLAPLIGLVSDVAGEPVPILKAAGILAAFGAVGGSIAGAIAPAERWRRVQLPSRVGMGAGVGSGVFMSMSVAF
jgi:hypothetical protein